jgi:hypothetical protein
MTCHQVQTELSLYLYGELDFAREEALEQHLAECAFCQQALAREKAWHASASAEARDLPYELLNRCRAELSENIAIARSKNVSAPKLSWGRRLLESLNISSSPKWSLGLAVASFLVIFGFTAGRWADRNGIPGLLEPDNSSEMSLFGPNTRVRDVQPGENGQVRIFIDQVRQGEVVARLDDDRVRQLLLAATQDPNDPAVRVDSVEILEGQNGTDVRDALLATVRHDPNAAVRLQALEGLRNFSTDAETRQVLKYVLENDTDAGVRSEAIDILAPAAEQLQFNPDLVSMLQEVARSEQSDDYVRLRCLQILGSMQASLDTY